MTREPLRVFSVGQKCVATPCDNPGAETLGAISEIFDISTGHFYLYVDLDSLPERVCIDFLCIRVVPPDTCNSLGVAFWVGHDSIKSC